MSENSAVNYDGHMTPHARWLVGNIEWYNIVLSIQILYVFMETEKKNN